jgi:glycosyltransferase involved in cell wall biosynthesis
MVASDVFVLSSKSEGSPNVILEALAAGTPVLANNIRGIPELVTNGKEGFLFDAGDVPQMVALLTRLLHDSQLRLRMSNKGKNRAKNFPPNVQYDRVFVVCVKALDSARK